MAGARAVVRRRAMRGVVPWALAGVVVLGAGSVGTVFADGWSRKVTVTVDSADRHGHCRVTWTDPWTGRTRHGPMDCPPGVWEQPLRAGDQSTESVAEWPWRGQLFEQDSGDGPAFTAAAWVALAGAVMVVGALVVAVYRRFVRRSTKHGAGAAARAETGAGGPGTVGAQGTAGAGAEPTYANLAAAAQAQWRPAGRPAGRRPRGKDVREVPWWRVRALRAGVQGELAFAVLFAVVVSTGGSGRVGGLGTSWSGILAAAMGVLIVVQIWRDARSALALARAARSPFTTARRYVAVRDPRGGGLWMLLFPRDGGADDVPEAMLPLSSGRRTGRRRYGVPDAPVGEVELHSDPARSGTVVPWSAGRPVWPSGPLVTLDAGDPELRAALRNVTSPGAAPAVRRNSRAFPSR